MNKGVLFEINILSEAGCAPSEVANIRFFTRMGSEMVEEVVPLTEENFITTFV